MGRKILFITTDQMRYDAIGANGGNVARTPNIDSFAADGISYDRAQPQNVVYAITVDDGHWPEHRNARRLDERRSASR